MNISNYSLEGSNMASATLSITSFLDDGPTTFSEFYDSQDTTINNTLVADKPIWDREVYFVSKESLRLVELTLHCSLSFLFVAVGIPGNVLCLIVFARQGLKDRINVLLFSIAVADLMNLLTVLISRLNCFMNEVDSENFAQIRFAHVSYINRYFAFVTRLLILLMTLDRCITVTFPFKAANILSFRRMLGAIIIIYGSILAAVFPMMVAFTVRWQYSTLYKQEMAQAVVGDYFKANLNLCIDIGNAVNSIVIPISLFLVIVLSVISVIVLRTASNRRAMMTGDVKNTAGPDAGRRRGQRSEAGVTRMLLLLSFVYIACTIPDVAGVTAVELVYDFYPFRKYHYLVLAYFGVTIALECFNSSVNFFAYLAMSRKFRGTLAKVLPCCDRLYVVCRSRPKDPCS